eukprot:8901655-Pyramimonas_sp.AAC.1
MAAPNARSDSNHFETVYDCASTVWNLEFGCTRIALRARPGFHGQLILYGLRWGVIYTTSPLPYPPPPPPPPLPPPAASLAQVTYAYKMLTANAASSPVVVSDDSPPRDEPMLSEQDLD